MSTVATQKKETASFIERIWEEFEKYKPTTEMSIWWYAESIIFELIGLFIEELEELHDERPHSEIYEQVLYTIAKARKATEKGERFYLHIYKNKEKMDEEIKERQTN